MCYVFLLFRFSVPINVEARPPNPFSASAVLSIPWVPPTCYSSSQSFACFVLSYVSAKTVCGSYTTLSNRLPFLFFFYTVSAQPPFLLLFYDSDLYILEKIIIFIFILPPPRPVPTQPSHPISPSLNLLPPPPQRVFISVPYTPPLPLLTTQFNYLIPPPPMSVTFPGLVSTHHSCITPPQNPISPSLRANHCPFFLS